MPPNKKKKKPASNPARGFTTVSVPSKQKSTVSSEAASSQDTPKDAQESPEERAPSHAPTESAPSGTKPELQELSSEELERHLEEAELQSLVEKYGAKCKNDASRQVTRLETDRRVLRSQAQPLLATNWLSLELLGHILEKEKADLGKPQRRSNKSNVDDESKPGTEDEMCAKLWTLQRTLSELGFSEPRIVEALKEMDLSCSKDLLDQALDWLAIYCDESELPQYGERKTVPKSGVALQRGRCEESCPLITLANASIGEVEPVTPGAATPQDNGSRTRKPAADLPPTPLDSTSDDSDVSDDPQSLVPRYITLNSRLYGIQPSLFEGSRRNAKKSAFAEETNAESDREVHKLRQKLAKIENDVLFDRQQAEANWQEKLSELRSTTAESSRQKLGEKATETENSAEKEDQVDMPPGAPLQGDLLANEEGDDGDDGDGILGSIFGLEPDNSASESVKLPVDANITTKLRDFGKSAGTSPRRVLEEACRARFDALAYFLPKFGY